MKEYIQELFQSRTRHSQPNYQDWQTFLDLITYIYVLNRDAPIYSVYRGARNLRNAVETTISTLQALSNVAEDRVKRDVEVDTSAFDAARRNLRQFGDTMLDRGVNSANEIRPLERFNNKNDQVLVGLKEGVGNDVSPEEAKALLQTYMDAFRSLEQAFSSKLPLLSSGLSNYLSLNLRGTGLSVIAKRASRVMDEIGDEIDLGSLEIKKAIDKLVSIQSTVNTLAKVADPTLTILTGTGASYGTGTAASITSTLSSPWDFESGVSDELDLNIDGVVQPTITLQTGSRAYAETSEAQVHPAAIFPPGTQRGWSLGCRIGAPSGPLTLQVKVDEAVAFSGLLALYDVGVYPATPYISFDELQAILTGLPGLSVTVPRPGVLRIERTAVGDTRSFRFSADRTVVPVSGVYNPIEATGLGDSGELTAGPTLVDKSYRGTSITSDLLALDLRNKNDKLNPLIAYQERIAGTYGYLSSGTRLEVYKIQDAAGGLQTTYGSTTVSSTTYNFVGKEVVAGDKIKFDGNTYSIVAVDENDITLDSASSSASGGYNFEIYPDTSSIQVGDVMEVADSALIFSSYHRVTAVSEGNIDTADPFFYSSVDAEFRVLNDAITLASKSVATDSSIQVLASANPANTELGLPVTEARGTVDQWDDSGTDYADYTILVDDVLRISVGDQAVISVGDQLTLSEEFTNNLNETYSLVNPDREALDAFVAQLNSWISANLNYWRELDEYLPQLVLGYPHPDAITAWQNKISPAIAAYQQLLSYIDDLSVRRLTDVDDVYRLLEEGGFDRARDLLLGCDFESFFVLESEEATYQGYFQMETQGFVKKYIPPDTYIDPKDTELEEYELPDLESESLGSER